MLRLPYMSLVWKTQKGFAVFSMVFITLMQFLILFVVKTFDTGSIIAAVVEQFPPRMKIFLNDSFFSSLTLDGAAAFGLNHPLVLTLLAMNAIRIPTIHISREIESGTLELLLSHPFRRRSLILSLWFSGCLILLVVVFAGWAGSVASTLIYHTLDAGRLAKITLICLNLWLLFLVIQTYSVLFSVFARGTVRSGTGGPVLTLILYLLYFLSQLWDSVAFTKHFNIFHYFQPLQIMQGESNTTMNFSLLLSLSIFLFIASVRQFEKRDVP